MNTFDRRDMERAYGNLEACAKHATDLPMRIKIATNEAFEAIESVMSDNALKAAGDDRAMTLELIIFEFICKSNGVDWRVFLPFEESVG
jgi:hypothetical protein